MADAQRADAPGDPATLGAQAGPVVFVTVSRTRADALILTEGPDPVRVVPLPGLTEDLAYDHADRLRSGCLAAHSRALHHATTLLRARYLHTPSLWAAHTHHIFGSWYVRARFD